MNFFFKRNSGPPASDGNASTRVGELPSRSAKPAKQLLVIDGDAKMDWSALFKGCTVRVRRGAPATAQEEEGDGVGQCAEGEHDEIEVRVTQAGWSELLVCSYDDGCVVDICRAHGGGAGGGGGGGARSVRPDFVLVRNEVRGVGAGQDWRPSLWGLMHGGVPSLNSLESISAFCERPVVHAQLKAIERRLGRDGGAFPLIGQNYYPCHRAMLIGPSAFPGVMKVGHAHAGYGKMRVADHHEFADFRSVMAVAGNYCTAEPFVASAHDVRVQKIGAHYRAFKRVSVSGNWKTNTGSSMIQQVPVTEAFKRWADEAAKMFGGLDICTVDAVVKRHKRRLSRTPLGGSASAAQPGGAGGSAGDGASDGGDSGAAGDGSGSGAAAVDELVDAMAALDDPEAAMWAACEAEGEGEDEYVILEVNGTSSGFAPDTEEEDNRHIRDLVLQRMAQLWG